MPPKQFYEEPKIVLLALSLFLFGSVFANENMAVETLVSNEMCYNDDTKARDTTVTTDLENYKNVIAKMEEIGWYFDVMTIDTKNNTVKIRFTDTPPNPSNSKSERATRKHLFHGKGLFRSNKGK